MKQILQTKRLIIREVNPDDIDYLTELMSHEKAMRYFPKLYSRKECLQMIEKMMFNYKVQGHGVWLLEDKELKKPVGRLGLVMQSVERKAEPEIGYILHPDHWHKGYATEAGVAVRNYAFDQLNYPHVISLIRPINLPSQAVATRLGMKISRKVHFFNYEHLVFKIDREKSLELKIQGN